MAFTAQDLVALPRIGGLALSPDGSRLVAAVSHLEDDSYRSTLLELAGTTVVAAVPGGFADAAPVFAWDGSLLHLSDRPSDQEGSTLWRQRPGGVDPEPVVTVPGGILSFAAASAAPVVVLKGPLHPGSADLAADASVETGSALVFDDYPVRWWDSWLGPRTPRVLRVDLETGEISDLTGDGGDAWCDVYGHLCAVSPDGSVVVTNRRRHTGPGAVAFDLVAIEGTGVRVLGDDGDYFAPAVSPDGRYVVAIRRDLGSPEQVETWTLVRFDLASDERLDLLPGWPLWPLFPVWTRDGATILFSADDQGLQPVYAVPRDGGEPVKLLADAGYDTLVPGPDGLYAVRGTVTEAPVVVRADLSSGFVEPLPFFEVPPLPGSVEEVLITASDGAVVRSWLVLPPGCSETSPAPLATWFHGGPAGSWSRWDWRWNPHVFASEGWAVLLPDVAQSVGYGPDFQARGRGDWQGLPVTDALDVVSAVAARPDIDGTRLVAGGGSFGGYLTNALAVREHPFRALVAACSIWSMDQHRGTSDSGNWGQYEFGTGGAWRTGLLGSSPEVHADRLRTPMLVIHGERDMRVPIDQALRLWTDLRMRDVEGRLLVFTDEGHHLPSRPRNVVRVYEEIFALLAKHVSG